MRANANSSKPGRNLVFWLLAVAGAALVLALLAPTAVGRLVGELWLTTMSAVVGLIAGLFGG